jgi:hypothetical protein
VAQSIQINIRKLYLHGDNFHPLPLTPSPIKGEGEPELLMIKNVAGYILSYSPLPSVGEGLGVRGL